VDSILDAEQGPVYVGRGSLYWLLLSRVALLSVPLLIGWKPCTNSGADVLVTFTVKVVAATTLY